ncbi:hypothetical protein ig2599ANME_0535 [groundwater metagenome]
MIDNIDTRGIEENNSNGSKEIIGDGIINEMTSSDA